MRRCRKVKRAIAPTFDAAQSFGGTPRVVSALMQQSPRSAIVMNRGTEASD